jgi:tetratricopeptide (TPR) repeat protein
MQAYADALARHETLGNNVWICIIRANLGELAQGDGRFDEAREHHEVALALAREGGDRKREAASLRVIGNLEVAVGDLAAARQAFEAAARMSGELGAPTAQAHAWVVLSEIDAREGAFDAAHARLDKAGRVIRATDDRLEHARLLVATVRLARAEGDSHAEQLALAEVETLRGDAGIDLVLSGLES